jgi:hypothetical protein
VGSAILATLIAMQFGFTVPVFMALGIFAFGRVHFSG